VGGRLRRGLPRPGRLVRLPFAIYMGKEKETSAAEKDTAVLFKQFLLSSPQQVATLRFGLRPPVRTYPWTTRQPDQEVRLLRLPGAGAGLLQDAPGLPLRPGGLGTWFVDNYEK